MLKTFELRNPSSCLNKADDDEPIFVLRGKDALAAQAVRLWAAMAAGVHEEEKIEEARKLADEMDRWRKENAPVKMSTIDGPGGPQVGQGQLPGAPARRHWPGCVCR